jgi:membrane protein required for beta-lactamase induction
MTEQQTTSQVTGGAKHLPLILRDAPVEKRLDFINRKINQSRLLMWLGLVLCGLLLILKLVSFFDPMVEATESLAFDLAIVAALIVASIGNRKMMKRYKGFKEQLEQEASAK